MYLQQPKNIRRSLLMNRTMHSAEKSSDNHPPLHHQTDSLEMQSSPIDTTLPKDKDTDLDEESTKMKEEAKQLIAKTKQMMLELNKDKPKREHSMSKDRISTLTNSTSTLNHFSQKLLDKAKRIKVLERELKDRSAQLRIAQDKLQMKNEEIAKLNEALTVERSNTLKAENAKLQRKIFAIEKANEDNKKVYEKLIEEYKAKISQCTAVNKEQEGRIKEIEQHNKKIAFDVNKLQANVHQKDTSVKELMEKVDIEKKASEHKESEIAAMKNQMSTLIAIIKSLYEKECNRQKTTSAFLGKLKALTSDDDLMKSGMSHQSDYGYDRAGMNNIDYQNRLNQQGSGRSPQDIAIDYSFN